MVNMEQPLISVIIPVYNVEKYLNECIESVVNQTYRNLEIILVDDGSTDHSPEICNAWANRDTRIKVIHKENGGASSARNVGIAVSTGAYIGFVDSDDYVAREMYELLYCALKNSDVKLSSCALARVDSKRKVGKVVGESESKTLNTREAINQVFCAQIGVSVCTKLFEQKVFDNIRFPEGETNEDTALVISLIEEAGGLVHIGKVLYFYRAREDSITMSTWKTDAYIVLRNLDGLQKQILDDDLNECQRSFDLFAAKSSYAIAIELDKHFDQLNCNARKNLQAYIQLMWRNVYHYMTCANIRIKDKILYLLIMIRMFRVVYKLCERF